MADLTNKKSKLRLGWVLAAVILIVFPLVIFMVIWPDMEASRIVHTELTNLHGLQGALAKNPDHDYATLDRSTLPTWLVLPPDLEAEGGALHSPWSNIQLRSAGDPELGENPRSHYGIHYLRVRIETCLILAQEMQISMDRIYMAPVGGAPGDGHVIDAHTEPLEIFNDCQAYGDELSMLFIGH